MGGAGGAALERLAGLEACRGGRTRRTSIRIGFKTAHMSARAQPTTVHPKNRLSTTMAAPLRC